MSQEYNSYPLSWPIGWKRTQSRIRSRFGSYYKKPSVAHGSRTILEELKRMGIPDFQVVISTNVQLRLDGLPYSNQKEPTDTGAAVYFTLDGEKKVIACDKYNTVGDNLYAIGKTIEATRAIERWGSVTTKQAFAGYAALAEKTGPSCWEVLGLSNTAFADSDNARKFGPTMIMDAYRRRARETHPDNGGSAEAFSEVCRAKDIALQMIQK